MQKEITEPSDLHDEDGHLIQKGWAKKLILQHRKDRVKAGKLRIKDWDCYEVISPNHGFIFIIADIGYFGMATHDFINFKEGKKMAGLGLKLFTKGSLNLPSTSEEGDVVFSKKNFILKFDRKPNELIVTIHNPKFQKRLGMKGEITFSIDPKMDSMVNVVPFKDPKHFVYAQKIIGMSVKGQIRIGNEEYIISEKNGYTGYLDWSRGVFPYKTSWFWGAASGIVNGKKFGFNIDYGFGDESHASKNMLFLNDVGHKIDKITFHYDKNEVMKPWKFTSNDGRFEMTLDPVYDNSSKLSMGILKTSGNQVFGYYTGDAILDDGTKIHVDRLFGWAEAFNHRW